MSSRREAPLRRIAVTVDRPGAGRFRWRLIEQAAQDSAWVGLQQAGKSFGSYHAAMAAGLVALEALIDDVEEGPVGAPEVEDVPSLPTRRSAPVESRESRVEDATPNEEDPADTTPASATPDGAFGFGGLKG